MDSSRAVETAPAGPVEPAPAAPLSLLSRLMQAGAINRAVMFGLLAKSWNSVSTLVTIALIASHFSPAVQGYYYTFGNLLALQVFAELGLGYVVIQFASHEWSQLGFGADGGVVGAEAAMSRLVGLGRLAFRWYAVSGAAIALGLGATGYVFFARSPSSVHVTWQAPWWTLSAVTGVNVGLVPLWSLLEGCNQVASVYAYRFMNGIVMGLTLWFAIASGLGLWAQPIAAIAGIGWGVTFLAVKYRPFFRIFIKPAAGPLIGWRSEILPMQWKIAVSWISGYFIFYIFAPVIFRLFGPVVAGRAGMTLALANAISAGASTWVFSRAPQFGIMIARREYGALDKLFVRVAIISFVVACVAAVGVWGAVHWLYAHGHPLAVRVLPPLPTGLFLFASVLMQIPFAQSVYLRAHKREPFLILSVIQAILTAVSIVVLGQRFGVLGIAFGNLAVIAFFVVPLSTVIWLQCRREWHPAAPAPWRVPA